MRVSLSRIRIIIEKLHSVPCRQLAALATSEFGQLCRTKSAIHVFDTMADAVFDTMDEIGWLFDIWNSNVHGILAVKNSFQIHPANRFNGDHKTIKTSWNVFFYLNASGPTAHPVGSKPSRSIGWVGCAITVDSIWKNAGISRQIGPIFREMAFCA